MTLIVIIIAVFISFLWFVGIFNKNRHKCNELGNCNLRCPWCDTFGFYNYYHDIPHKRKYYMCKYCGKVKDKGKEAIQCYREICPKCFPNYKRIEQNEGLIKISDELGERSQSTKSKTFFTWTMKPGHPCAVCETKMVVFKPTYNLLKKRKEKLYKYHGYNLLIF